MNYAVSGGPLNSTHSLLVIIVVVASARMRTVTNYFIANLSIADVRCL